MNCLSVNDHVIFVGCEDGGLRLTSVGIDGHLDYQPQLFPSINGIDSFPLTSIHSVAMNPSDNMSTNGGNALKVGQQYLCGTGSKDGTVATFYLSKATK